MRVAGLEARLEALGHQVTDGGNILVEIGETQRSGDKSARYLVEIAENLHAHRRSRHENAARGHDASGTGRGPLAGGRLGVRA